MEVLFRKALLLFILLNIKHINIRKMDFESFCYNLFSVNRITYR